MKTKIISYKLSYGFRHQNHTEKILVPIFLSAGPLGQRTTSQFIEDMHPSVPSISGTSTLACRLENLPHGDILYHPCFLSRGHLSPHVSQIHTYVSGTSVSGIRRGNSASGTSVSAFCFRDNSLTTPLGFPTRGHPVRPSVSETSVCTIRFGEPSWPSVSSPSVLASVLGTSDSAFKVKTS